MTTLPTIRLRSHHNVLRAKLGRRGASLLLFASVWALIGVGYLTGPATPYPTLIRGFPNGSEIAGLLWIASAVVAFVGAFHVLDRWAFAALCAMPTASFLAHLWDWFMWLVPGAPYGNPRGWYSALIWIPALMFVLVQGGRREPEDEGVEL